VDQPAEERAWAPLAERPDGSVVPDPAALGEPGTWTAPQVVWVAERPDPLAPTVGDETVADLVAAVGAEPTHQFVLCTDRVKRLLALGNDGLRFPPNLWPGVRVRADEEVWRAEDLLRCNTDHAWVSAVGLRGPLASLPVDLLRWVVGSLDPATGPTGMAWARELRDRCVRSGVPFTWLDGIDGGLLDGRAWRQRPAPLRTASGSPPPFGRVGG
jgi:protein gp37